jgi:hypothetical protein
VELSSGVYDAYIVKTDSFASTRCLGSPPPASAGKRGDLSLENARFEFLAANELNRFEPINSMERSTR